MCPRNIPVHRGHPQECGQACARAQTGNPVEYDKENYFEVIAAKRTYAFNEGVCRISAEHGSGEEEMA